MNHTDERILKLARCGLTDEQIARKIGRPNDLERVRRAIGQRSGDGERRRSWDGNVLRACHKCNQLAPFQGGSAFFCSKCVGGGK